MASKFRCYLENEYDNEYRQKIFTMLEKWYDLNDEDTNTVKDYIWKCLGDKLEKFGINRNTIKMKVSRTNGWHSDAKSILYELAFLKSTGELCTLDIYENMMICSIDAFIEEHGW